jgi:hypothetical protein
MAYTLLKDAFHENETSNKVDIVIENKFEEKKTTVLEVGKSSPENKGKLHSI